MFVFRKIWRALFSCDTCFLIRSFALLLTRCAIKFIDPFQANFPVLYIPPKHQKTIGLRGYIRDSFQLTSQFHFLFLLVNQAEIIYYFDVT